MVPEDVVERLGGAQAAEELLPAPLDDHVVEVLEVEGAEVVCLESDVEELLAEGVGDA